MNSFLVFLISSYLVTSTLADFGELHKKSAQECKTELNAKDEDLAVLKSFEIPKTEIQSCLIDCLYGKLGLIKDGKISEEAYKGISRSIAGNDKNKLTKMDEVFQKCAKEVEKVANQKCNIGKTVRTCANTHFSDAFDPFKAAIKSS